MVDLSELWHHIEGAPTYIISDHGRVRLWSLRDGFVVVRETAVRRRKYVNLMVEGKVKRFYLKPLMKRYFGSN